MIIATDTKHVFLSMAYVISPKFFSGLSGLDKVCGVESKFQLGFEFRRHDWIAIDRAVCSRGISSRLNFGSVDIPSNYQPVDNTRSLSKMDLRDSHHL